MSPIGDMSDWRLAVDFTILARDLPAGFSRRRINNPEIHC
jgi:hypothetical protein